MPIKNKMGKDRLHTPMAIYLKESFLMEIASMQTLLKKMEIFIKARWEIWGIMGKVVRNLKIELRQGYLDKEFSFMGRYSIQMDQFTKVLCKMEWNQGRLFIKVNKAIIQDILSLINSKEMVS